VGTVLGLLAWNNHIGEGKKGYIIVDGRGLVVEGDWGTIFVTIRFHHFLKDTKARICHQKNVAWKRSETRQYNK
jgi:hypothetical protein